MADKTSPGGAGPLPGARLLREWNGTTHVVDFVGDRYRWSSETYRSLSAVTTAIVA